MDQPNNSKTRLLIIITSAYFVAGVILGKQYNQCAPIVHYMTDWSLQRIKQYCDKKHWKYQEFNSPKVTPVLLNILGSSSIG